MKKLLLIHAATSLDDLRLPPSNQLEKKAGGLKNHYSIRVDQQWRITFQWEGSNAYDVRFWDYH